MKRILSVLLILCLPALLAADRVVLVNGDSLSGKIKTMGSAELVLDSDMAGEISIPRKNIKTFSSARPVEVHLKGGEIHTQPIAGSGDFAVSLKNRKIDIASIESINPPPKKAPQWQGDFSAGLTSTHGNSNIKNMSASFNAAKRREDDRIRISGDYARSEQRDEDTGKDELTENWWRVKGKYDYFYAPKCFVYLDTRYETDDIADLDYRYILGSGFGQQFIESDEMNFSVEAGLAYLKENFETNGDNSNCTIQIGYNFDKKINSKLKFMHDLTYYPNWQEVSDYFLTTTGELRLVLSDRVFTNFKAIFDYDSTPARDSGSTDTKYLLGIGGSF